MPSLPATLLLHAISMLFICLHIRAILPFFKAFCQTMMMERTCFGHCLHKVKATPLIPPSIAEHARRANPAERSPSIHRAIFFRHTLIHLERHENTKERSVGDIWYN